MTAIGEPLKMRRQKRFRAAMILAMTLLAITVVAAIWLAFTADAPTESFGLYGLSGRATAFIAPSLILLVTDMTGSVRLGMSPIVVLFIIGLIPLFWVKPEGDQTG